MENMLMNMLVHTKLQWIQTIYISKYILQTTQPVS